MIPIDFGGVRPYRIFFVAFQVSHLKIEYVYVVAIVADFFHVFRASHR